MPWTITRYPPTPGPHSLGDSVVTFDAEGVAHTDDEATAQKAMEFPETFTVEDLSAPPPEPTPDVEPAEADDEGHHGRRRPTGRRGED